MRNIAHNKYSFALRRARVYVKLEEMRNDFSYQADGNCSTLEPHKHILRHKLEIYDSSTTGSAQNNGGINWQVLHSPQYSHGTMFHIIFAEKVDAAMNFIEL